MLRSSRARTAVFLSATTTVIVAAAACTSFTADEPAGAGPDATADVASPAVPDGQAIDASDAALAPAAICDSRLPFERIEPLSSVDEDGMPINTSTGAERGTSLSKDELTLYFHREGADQQKSTLLVATRAMPSGPFLTVVPVAIDGSGMHFDANPQLSPDGTLLLFDSDRTTKTGLLGHTLFSVVLAAGPSVSPKQLAIPAPVAEPFVRGNELFYTQTPSSGDYTIAVTDALGSVPGVPLAAVVNAGTGKPSTHAVLSADGLDLYFARRLSASVNYRIHRATRPTVGAPFGSATPLPVVTNQGRTLNGADPSAQSPLWISSDNCRLYFEKTPLPTEQYDLFVAIRTPSKR